MLSEVAQIQGGIQKQSKRAPRENHYPFLRVANVTSKGLDLSEIHRIELFGDELNRLRLQRGDLLVVEGNGSPSQIGRAAIWNGAIDDCVHQNHLIRVRAGSVVLPEYLHLYWNSPANRDFLTAISSSTSGLHTLSVRKLQQVEVPIPPLEEQQRIVAILDDHLSRLDAAEELMRTSQRRLNVMDRAVIDDVMVRRAEESGWPVVSLGELVGDKRTMTDGPFGSHLTSAHYSAAGAQVVRLQNIGDGQYKEAAAFIPLDHYSSLEKHNVVEGDVVVASLGDNLPRAAVVPDLGGPAIVKADCIRVRLPEQVEAQWVVLACRSSRAKHWARDRLHGVGRQRLGLGGIRDIPVPFPPSPAVRRSALEWMCDQLDNSILLRSDLDQELKRAEALRRSLLAAAFTGALTSGYEPEEGVA